MSAEVVVEKPVLAHYRGMGIFRSVCEVVDTTDPEVKIFRFKEGCTWGSKYDPYPKPKPKHVRVIRIYSFWSEPDVGEQEGVYRITRVLDPLPGYIAVLEGTTKPEVREEEPTLDKLEAESCESAITSALEAEPRMSVRALRRKVSSHRYPCFDDCLKQLAEQGEIKLESDPAQPQRVWVSLSASVSQNVSGVSNKIADSNTAEG